MSSTPSPGSACSRTSAARSSRPSPTPSPRSPSPPGQRILRQGFAGTGFYVILEGEVTVRIDGEDRARLGKGDFFGEMSLLLGEPPVADVVALTPLRVLHLAGPTCSRSCSTIPPGDVPDAPVGRRRAGRNANRRGEPGRPMSTRAASASSPSRPATTPSSWWAAVRAGSRPRYCLVAPRHRPRRHLRRPRARRHVPPLPVLPAAAVVDQAVRHGRPHDSRQYERYDWNSLLADEPEHRALMSTLMDGTSDFPSRPEMEAGPPPLRGAHRVCASATARAGRATSPRRRPVRAPHQRRRLPLPGRRSSPSASPSRGRRTRPGSEHVAHYVDTRDAASLRRQAPVHRGQAELRLRARQRPAAVGEPHRPGLAATRRSCRSTCTRWPASGPATSSPGRTPTWAAACSSSTRRSSASSGVADGIAVHTRRSDSGEPFVVEVDEVIAATGFRCPLRRPAAARRHACSGRAGLPMMTNHYESATVPGLFFAGTIGAGRARAAQVRHPGQLGSRPRARATTCG